MAVWIWRLLPMPLRRIFWNLSLSSADKEEPAVGLRELFAMHDALLSRLDRCAIRYDGGILHPKHRLMRYHDFFIGRLQPGEKVLDIGCGIGAVAHCLAQAGADVTGIDINEENISMARTRYRHPNLRFLVGDATHRVPPGNFDAIVLSNVLEHIRDRHAFLALVQGQLNPKKWLIRVPMLNRHWMVPLKGEIGCPQFSDPTHFTEYTEESFREEMSAMGFVIRHYEQSWGEIWAEVTGA